MPDAYIGIDWGTLSSKWSSSDSNEQVLIGPIWESAVCRFNDSLEMYLKELRHRGELGDSELKRKLIRDPDQPFWEGERHRLGATLGEAVVFSLYGLLNNVRTSLTARGISLSEMDSLTVRFSHPNWVTPDTVLALQYYRDAAVVALAAFSKGISTDKDEDSFRLDIRALRELIQRHKAPALELPKLPPLYDHWEYERCLRGSLDGIKWEFVFESCAAGFPYLVQAEPETFESDTGAHPGQLWIRKILVVDIGAGSTDSGYLLRTIRRDPRTGRPAGPMMIWLPAAPALERAGNWLTDRLREDRIREGKPATTRDEAEDYKTSGVTDWYRKPYVDEWCQAIAGHVASYVSGIPDSTRLPRPPPLEVVITGGSSAVEPVRGYLLDGAKKALRERGVGANLSQETRPLIPVNAALLGEGYTDIQCAQLAVSLGAAHPRMTELKHYPEGM